MSDINQGIRADGTVEGCVVETYNRWLDYITQRDGYVSVVADDGPVNVEVRVPNEALIELGWTPPSPKETGNE